MPHAMKASFKQMLGKAKKDADKLAARIAEAHAAGEHGKALALQREFVGSFHARFVATADAASGMPRDRRPSKAAILAMAKRLNVWNPSTEPVEVFLKAK